MANITINNLPSASTPLLDTDISVASRSGGILGQVAFSSIKSYVFGSGVQGVPIGTTTPSIGAFTTVSGNSTTNTTSVLSYNAAYNYAAYGASSPGYLSNITIQNTSAAANSGVQYVASNNSGTGATYFGAFGMLASGYTATTYTSFFGMNGQVFLSAKTADLTIGAMGGNTYFAYGSTGQFAHSINANGAIGFTTNLGTSSANTGTTNYGTSGYTVVCGGSSAAPTWGVLGVGGGGTGVTTSTGTGSVVLNNSPTFITPALGTPSSGTLTNATGLPLGSGVTGVLPAANGGLGVGAGSAANGSIPIGNGTGFSLATLTQGSGISITNSAGGITIASTGSWPGTPSVIATNTNASVNSYYECNTTSASFTLTLPATATAGQWIQVNDYAGTFGTNPLTIANNGLNIMFNATTMTVSTNNASFTLVYVNATKGWSIVN